ncbi:MAG: DUF58 domain-containing protein [Bacteroidia bacterium]
MDRTAELLKKVRRIELKTRGLSKQLFAGEYHSAFKGRGMSFSEVREYQYGDDVRNIDWNVTARTGDPYIKIFEEEREMTVILMVDVSGSTHFGTNKGWSGDAVMKQDLLTEISAVIAFSATNNNDKVGVIFFSDRVEKFIPPKKGRNHILRIIRELIDFKPEGQGSDLNVALRYLRNMLKKRTIVFVMSDFRHSGEGSYIDSLSIARRRHDLIGVQVYDEREANLPSAGLLRLRDAETGATRWVDSSSKATRSAYGAWFRKHLAETRDTFMKAGADLVSLNTNEAYVKPLMNLFRMRERRR